LYIITFCGVELLCSVGPALSQLDLKESCFRVIVYNFVLKQSWALPGPVSHVRLIAHVLIAFYSTVEKTSL